MPFQSTPLQTLIGALAAIAGGIAASLLSGHYLIKKVLEEKRVEMFVDVLDNVYAPFQEIAEEIIKENEISNGQIADLLTLIRENINYILRCPGDIKKEIWILRENLKSENQEEAVESVKALKRKIDKSIDKIALER